jgi:hypothetical protein
MCSSFFLEGWFLQSEGVAALMWSQCTTALAGSCSVASGLVLEVGDNPQGMVGRFWLMFLALFFENGGGLPPIFWEIRDEGRKLGDQSARGRGC